MSFHLALAILKGCQWCSGHEGSHQGQVCVSIPLPSTPPALSGLLRIEPKVCFF